MSTTNDEEHVAEQRASELARLHSLRKPVARACAYREMGYSFSGIATKVDATDSTVSNWFDKLESQDRFGWGVAMPKPEAERHGPLESASPKDPRRCPVMDCQSRSVVSVAHVDDTFSSKSTEFSRKVESARVAGAEFICTSCYDYFGRDVDREDDAGPPFARRLQRDARWVATRGSDKAPCAPWQTGDDAKVDAQNIYVQTDFGNVAEWIDKYPANLGYGVVPSGKDRFVVFDFDGCVDPGTRKIIDPDIAEYVERLDSYTEVSGSGTGLHVFVRASPPGNLELKEAGVEMYISGQYVAVTFDHFEGTPTDVEARDDATLELYRELEGESPTVTDITPYDGEAPDSPIYRSSVADLFDVPLDKNVPHPVHGSEQTGANFRVESESPSMWRCWRHGVSGNVSQLLAIAYLVEVGERSADSVNCADVAKQWRQDDALVTRTWAWAVSEGLIGSDTIPARVDPSSLDNEG